MRSTEMFIFAFSLSWRTYSLILHHWHSVVNVFGYDFLCRCFPRQRVDQRMLVDSRTGNRKIPSCYRCRRFHRNVLFVCENDIEEIEERNWVFLWLVNTIWEKLKLESNSNTILASSLFVRFSHIRDLFRIVHEKSFQVFFSL